VLQTGRARAAESEIDLAPIIFQVRRRMLTWPANTKETIRVVKIHDAGDCSAGSELR
jgi:hypothetical protein